MLGFIGVIIGILSGIFVTVYFYKKSNISKVMFDELKNENIQLKTKLEIMSTKDIERDLELKKINEALRQTTETSIRITSDKENLERRIKDSETQFKTMSDQIKLTFETTANNIFEQKNEHFKKQSTESINVLLSPLKEKLDEFQKKVDNSFGEQAKEQVTLKTEIKNIIETSRIMSDKTENLTRALKGDVKAQGNWGEILLEKILEESGLRKDHDYRLQGVDLGLKHPETGASQKPDVIINLPDNKHIIIDSKVSLKHYEAFISEDDGEAKLRLLKSFVNSIKEHINGLEKRKYQDIQKLGTPDFVLMFMPIEGAFSLALQHEPELHRHAWDKKIVLVCPSMLFATLRTISSIWKLELQNKNVQEIAKTGGALYDKVSIFIKSMQTLGTQLDTAKKTYDSSMTTLSGKGGILRQTELLGQLGAKHTKALPKNSFLEEEEQNMVINNDGI